MLSFFFTKLSTIGITGALAHRQYKIYLIMNDKYKHQKINQIKKNYNGYVIFENNKMISSIFMESDKLESINYTDFTNKINKNIGLQTNNNLQGKFINGKYIDYAYDNSFENYENKMKYTYEKNKNMYSMYYYKLINPFYEISFENSKIIGINKRSLAVNYINKISPSIILYGGIILGAFLSMC
jgi:hypothetical protein